MPPFVYPEYRNPYVANIVDLMQQAGAAQAAGVRQAGEAIGQGQRQAGDIYGQFFGGLGQIPQQLAAQQYRSAQIANMQQEMALRKAEADRLDRTARVQAEASDAYRQSIDPETGLVDPKKVQALWPTLSREAFAPYQDFIDKHNASLAARRKDEVALDEAVDKLTASTQAHVGQALNAYVTANDFSYPTTAALFAGMTSDLQGRSKSLPPALRQVPPNLTAAYNQLDATMSPDQVKAILLPAIQQNAGYQAAFQAQQHAGQIEVGPDVSVYQRPPLGGPPVPLIKGTPKPGSMEDWVSRWRTLATDAKGQPLTEAETQAVDSKAIQAFKVATTEPSTAAALERQAIAERFQVAQQARTQAFQEAQAGRSELTNKVEQPYLDTREKTQTIRNVVQAAQGGNMMAGAVQSLLATIGLVTAEGVKRINTTELEQVRGAGDLLTRIKGRIGSVIAGKPLPQELQTDLIGLADVLDKGAYDKYLNGFTRATQRYGLKDERPLPAPPPTPSGGGGGVRVLSITKVP